MIICVWVKYHFWEAVINIHQRTLALVKQSPFLTMQPITHSQKIQLSILYLYSIRVAFPWEGGPEMSPAEQQPPRAAPPVGPTPPSNLRISPPGSEATSKQTFPNSPAVDTLFSTSLAFLRGDDIEHRC